MIFNFTDYRNYLKAYITSLPRRGFGEAKRIAAHLSVSSTFISHVLSGAKAFSGEQATLLSNYLSHSDLEAEYFYYLVQLDRAGNLALKTFCQKKLVEAKSKSIQLNKRIKFTKELSSEQKSIFYSTPLYSAIHLFTSTKTKGVTIEDIQTRFDLSRKKIQEILNFLKDTNLCIQMGSHYKIGTQSTHVGAESPHLVRHHLNWRLRAIHAAESLSPEELMYTVNVSLTKSDFKLLREEMVQFINKFLKTVYPSPAEDLACFNIDFFWIRK